MKIAYDDLVVQQTATSAIKVLQTTLTSANNTVTTAVAFVNTVQSAGIASLRHVVDTINSTGMTALATVLRGLVDFNSTMSAFADAADAIVTSEIITIIDDVAAVLDLVFTPVDELDQLLRYQVAAAMLCCAVLS